LLEHSTEYLYLTIGDKNKEDLKTDAWKTKIN
jgi:hypothetical protein